MKKIIVKIKEALEELNMTSKVDLKLAYSGYNFLSFIDFVENELSP